MDEFLNLNRFDVVDDQPDTQLFLMDQREKKYGWCCLLYPLSDGATFEFTQTLADRLNWLSDDERQRMDLDERMAARIEGLRILFKEGRRTLRQHLFQMDLLPLVLAHCQGRKDHYLAQCSFKKMCRNSDSVHQLTSCWVDLDYYKLKDTETRAQLDTDQGALALIADLCTDGKGGRWFTPTQVVRSGKGLYVKWIFNHFLRAEAAPRWTAVMDRLIKKFLVLGADGAARDSARVLRVVGSINGKNGVPVTLLQRRPNIDFDDLAAAVLERKRMPRWEREQYKLIAAQSKKDRARSARERTGAKGKGAAPRGFIGGKTWSEILSDELPNLIEIRGKDGMRGRMEMLTYLTMFYRILAGRVRNEDDFDAQVNELGLRMGAELDVLKAGVTTLWKEYARAGNRLLRKPFKKQTLLQKLRDCGFTDQELAQLPACITNLPQAANGMTKNDRDETIMLKNEQHQSALLLCRSGVPLNEIAASLGVSRQTAKKWIEAAVSVEAK